MNLVTNDRRVLTNLVENEHIDYHFYNFIITNWTNVDHSVNTYGLPTEYAWYLNLIYPKTNIWKQT